MLTIRSPPPPWFCLMVQSALNSSSALYLEIALLCEVQISILSLTTSFQFSSLHPKES